MSIRTNWWQIALAVAILAVVIWAAFWFAPIVGPPSSGPVNP
jgi:hypothetical protein